ncbi:MAG: hypothetical protein ACK41T_10380 [Pseudobdellovibrio sp.]
MNIYILTEKTVEGNSVKKQDSKINTMLSSSVGYVADSHTLGVFQHYTEYKYKLSKTDVGFKTGTIGLYYIHKF